MAFNILQIIGLFGMVSMGFVNISKLRYEEDIPSGNFFIFAFSVCLFFAKYIFE